MRFTVFMKGMMAVLAGLVLCAGTAQAQKVAVPGFWDPNMAYERPQLTGQQNVRFVTDGTFPPLHFSGIDHIPTGFSVELARAACDLLQMTCTIQSHTFDMLRTSLTDRQADAIAAAIPITASLRQSFAVTAPYFRNPARFAARRAQIAAEIAPATLKGKRIGAVAASAYEAFLRRFFPDIVFTPFPDLTRAEQALKDGSIDFLFADGINLALWLGGTESADCCAFAGGPYLESAYFGEGIGFIFRPEDTALRRAFDYALHELWKNGKYAELYLRFFPVSPY